MKEHFKRRFPRLARWLAQIDLVVLSAVLIVVVGTWVFVEVADSVSEGTTQKIDDGILRAWRRPDNPAEPVGSKLVQEIVRDLTALGGVAVLCLVTLAVAGYLCIRRMYHAVALLLASTIGGLVVSSILKSAFARPRPELVPHLSQVYTSSFPSGHSMMSAIVYLTLGALMARFVEQRRLKVYFLTLAMLLTGLVGISRVYLGVHYPTDVLGGWSAGLSWALVCWLMARALQRRGAVEQPDAAGNPHEEAEAAATAE